jgi:hypothetical protein
MSDQPRVPTPPPAGHVENGWQWTGAQWVPFVPQQPSAPPGPSGPLGAPLSGQRPLAPPSQPGSQWVPSGPQQPSAPPGAQGNQWAQSGPPRPLTQPGPPGAPGVAFSAQRTLTPSGPPVYVRPAPVQGKSKKSIWKRWWVWAIAVVVVVGALSRLGGSPTTTGVANAPTTVASQNPSASAASASAAAASSSAAAASASAAQASASAAAASKAAASQAAEAARVNPASYKAISDRDWSVVQRDPDAHAGERYVVYGCITQFDANTGTDTFRANTGGAQQKSCWSYSVNTIVTAGVGTDLTKVAEDDLVKMYIEVVKAYTYTTTAGGSTTVPLVQVNIIQTTG